MPGKRISELTALSGAGSANNDDVVIFDADASETKRISRSQLAEGMVGDLPFQYFVGVLTSDPTQRLNGDPLQLADTYYNSVADQISFYDGAAWVSYDSVLTARDEAEAARDKAQEWATNPEDTPVETGQFSALHWSAKAEDEKLAAQTARTGAETAETNAETAEAVAVAAQLAAEAAEVNAETARDAAFVNADVYADTAAGLAAVALGEQFQVVAGDTVIRYREDAGPVATEVARYPSAAGVLRARAAALDWLVTVEDGNGDLLVPVFQYEPDLGLVWQNGAVRTVADALTDNGDGSFTLNTVPLGLSAGVTALVEWSREGHTGTPSGYMWSMVNNPVSLAGGVSVLSNWVAASEVAGGTLENRTPSTVDTRSMQRWGSDRAIVSVPVAGNSLRLIDGGEVLSGSATNVYLTPTRMDIGRRSRTTVDGVIANISVTRVAVFGGSMTAAQMRALNDAADRMEMTPQERWPEWLAVIPDGAGGYIVPAFQWDQKRKRCWYAGRERAESEVLIDAGDGSFIMKRGPRGLTSTSGMSVFVDVQPDVYYPHTDRPSGYPFHSSSAVANPAGLQERLEWAIQAVNDTINPGGLINTSAYSSRAGNFFGISPGPRPAAIGGAHTARRGQGILRYGIALPASGNILTSADAWPVNQSSLTVAAYVPQDYFRFGAQFGGSNPLTNCDIEQVIIYAQSLTSTQMAEVTWFNEYRADPLFFVGDSLNNVAQPMEQLRLHAAAAGLTYLPMMSDGNGGRGLSFFEEFIDAYVTEYDWIRDYRLILVEGGFDYQSLALDGVTTVGPYSERDIQQYLKGIMEDFRNPSAIIMEPNSNLVAEQDIAGGVTTGMDKWRATMTNIKETYPDFWCPIMALYQAQAANDAEYLAIRADGRVPPALRGDGIHPSWGTAFSSDPSTGNGYYWLSLAIFRSLMARDWVSERN